MEIIKQSGSQILTYVVNALQEGKVVAYPTDTSYGLAVDATNIKAIRKLYKVKERTIEKQPVHVIVPSIAYAKKIVTWNKLAQKLSKAFLPGPLTLVLPIKSDTLEGTPLIKRGTLWLLSARTGFLGVRMPANKIALDLAKKLGKPITTTSANPSGKVSGGYDSYSAQDVFEQFKDKKYKPDIILDGGKLPKRKPSTMVKVKNGAIEILRVGSISQASIKIALHHKNKN